MNSTNETIIARWNEYSLATKALLRLKHNLKLIDSPDALQILAKVTSLIEAKELHRTLILTNHISDAIITEMVLNQIQPDVKTNLVLTEKGQDAIDFNSASITIIPHPLFSLESIRSNSLPLLDFDLILIDENITPAFLYDLLFIEEINRPLLELDNHILLLSTNFHQITETIDQALASPPKSASPKSKISLSSKKLNESKTEAKPTQNKDIPNNPEPKVAKSIEETADSASNNQAVTKKADLPTVFIAQIPKNTQRQFIRDYIREHHLEHTLIIAHNRQSARLLEKYLYRARIRSRIVHEKVDKETALSLFDRYNKGQFSAFILMHHVIEDYADQIEKCDSIIFLDLPTVYAEYANRYQFAQSKLHPKHLVTIMTENDKVWMQAMMEEYPALQNPIISIDIELPKRKPKNPTTSEKEGDSSPKNNRDNRTKRGKSQNKPHEDRQTSTNQNEATSDTQIKEVDKDVKSHHQPKKKAAKPRNNRRNERSNSQAEHHQPMDNQSDFFSTNQDEIVNRNRLPFETGSFEANIARENRRRGRDMYNTPGGLGQSTSGNFIQNITQGISGNQSSNNSNRKNNRNNRSKPKNRKK